MSVEIERYYKEIKRKMPLCLGEEEVRHVVELFRNCKMENGILK
jgi:hypothetical protein